MPKIKLIIIKMKKNLTLVFLLFTLISFGQEDYNKWSVGLNFGSHDAMHPTPKFTKAIQLHHFGANGRYMMNSKVGIMLDVGYDYIDTYDNPVNTNYWRTSVQGVVNVGNLLCFDTWTKRVGLLVHGGAGFSHLWLNKDLRTVENPSDPLFKGVDDMLNYTFGSTVQFMVTDNIPFHEAGLLKLNCDKALFHLKWQANMEYKETIKFTSEWHYDFYKSDINMFDKTSQQITEYENMAIEKELKWTK